MKVLESLVRFYVNDMDKAIRFYERLFGEKCTTRFAYTRFNLEIARVGAVLIIAGTEKDLEPFRRTNATFLVDSLREFREFLVADGAEVLNDIQEVPTGWNMTVRHGDGGIVEYVEFKK